MLQKRKVSSKYVTRSDRCKHGVADIWPVGVFRRKNTDRSVAKIMVIVNHIPMLSTLSLSGDHSKPGVDQQLPFWKCDDTERQRREWYSHIFRTKAVKVYGVLKE